MIIGKVIGELQGRYVAADRDSPDFVRGEFEVYRALARLLAVESILEVGVYCGYSAAAMIAGGKSTLKRYVGIDAQCYRPDSNQEAVRLIRQMQNYLQTNIDVRIVGVNTQVDLPDDLREDKFDWIHIDAGHETAETIRDITRFWPLVRKCMTVHDVDSHPTVRAAVEHVDLNSLLANCSGSLEIKSLHGFRVFMH
jgi:predicted O-methyltransferase YrrM